MADRLTEEERLTPKTRRKRLLDRLHIEEQWLSYLRSLEVDEAKWIIRTERARMHEYVDEQYDFMLEDTVNNRPPKRTRRKKDDPVMMINPNDRTTGHRLG